jgi:toxin ParE1/3/4
MRLVLTLAATNDLRQLREYLACVSPRGLQTVSTAIEQRIQATLQFPESGRSVSHAGIREAVEPRYGFLIPYVSRGDVLIVLRIYRSARTPLDYEEIAKSLPEGH